MTQDYDSVQVGSRSVRVSHPDKVLYPTTGTTKREIIAYYRSIAETMLPHTRDRAATMKRWPNGVGENGDGKFFFQKNVSNGAPAWLETRAVQHKDHVNHYPLVNDEATLVWLAQLATLEIHVPQWRFGTGSTKRNPDRLVLDLDPGPGTGLRECADVAARARRLLRDLGLSAVPVTSGSTGLHLYAALDSTVTAERATMIAKSIARSLEEESPDQVVSSMKRSLRNGKVFIDWSQNNASKTTVAPYSLRGRRRPTVAAPRSWREIASPHLKQLEFDEVLRRVDRRGDPMKETV